MSAATVTKAATAGAKWFKKEVPITNSLDGPAESRSFPRRIAPTCRKSIERKWGKFDLDQLSGLWPEAREGARLTEIDASP